MHKLVDTISVTRYQSQFLLSGGSLSRKSYNTTRKYSMKKMHITELDDSHIDTFTWRNIKQQYKQMNHIK